MKGGTTSHLRSNHRKALNLLFRCRKFICLKRKAVYNRICTCAGRGYVCRRGGRAHRKQNRLWSGAATFERRLLPSCQHVSWCTSSYEVIQNRQENDLMIVYLPCAWYHTRAIRMCIFNHSAACMTTGARTIKQGGGGGGYSSSYASTTRGRTACEGQILTHRAAPWALVENDSQTAFSCVSHTTKVAPCDFQQ